MPSISSGVINRADDVFVHRQDLMRQVVDVGSRTTPSYCAKRLQIGLDDSEPWPQWRSLDRKHDKITLCLYFLGRGTAVFPIHSRSLYIGSRIRREAVELRIPKLRKSTVQHFNKNVVWFWSLDLLGAEDQVQFLHDVARWRLAVAKGETWLPIGLFHPHWGRGKRRS
jgi:hypothetical protein